MSAIKCWKISKYGRFIPNNAYNNTSKSTQNNWKIWESGFSNEIYISLNDPLNLIIRQGTIILESFSLHGSQKWLKAIKNGDSMLFIHKLKEQTRKFRIKFSGIPSASSIDQCLAFTNVINKYVVINNLEDKDLSQNSQPNNLQINDVEMTTVQKEITIEDTAKSLLNEKAFDIPTHYKTSNIPTQDINEFLQVCLLDPSFPAFVVEVEKSLKQMVNEKVS